MADNTSCPICGLMSYQVPYSDGNCYEINCDTCGTYSISRIAKRRLSEIEEIQKPKVKLSCVIRENQLKNLPEIKIVYAQNETSGATIDQLLQLFPKSFYERVDRALINLSMLSGHTGQKIHLREIDYPLFFVDDIGHESIAFMIDHLVQENLITTTSPVSELPCRVTITPKGWNRIYELQKGINKESRQAFIAMWFNPEMDKASDTIHNAIYELGFTPKRIDSHETNNKICDEIIAEIRKSKFVVCDYSGQRGGVYFEAGFAYGLGLPVIWCCREDWFNCTVPININGAVGIEGEVKGKTLKVIINEKRETHFDINHYNFIVWKDEQDLFNKLTNRISATIT